MIQDNRDSNILPSIEKLGEIFSKKNIVQFLRAASLLYSACFETVSLNQHNFFKKVLDD